MTEPRIGLHYIEFLTKFHEGDNTGKDRRIALPRHPLPRIISVDATSCFIGYSDEEVYQVDCDYETAVNAFSEQGALKSPERRKGDPFAEQVKALQEKADQLLP